MLPCSIIGQSNSIMDKGYFQKLLELGSVKLVGSARIGASPSVIGPYFVTDQMMQASRLCLIDCCIIDRTLLADGFGSLQQLASWIEWIGHKARINGCQPIFILIPIKFYTDKSKVCPLIALYESIISRHGYFFLDVRDLTTQLISQGVDADSLYGDGAHPGEQLAGLMAQSLNAFISAFSSVVYKRVRSELHLKDFRVINLAECAATSVTRVDYKRPFFDFHGIRLAANDRVDITTGSFERLHAVMTNVSQAFRKVAISGSDQMWKNLNIKPYTANAYEVRLIPIKQELKDKSGRLSLEIILDNSADAERSMTERDHFIEFLDFVEMSDLLVETSTRHLACETEVPISSEMNICGMGS